MVDNQLPIEELIHIDWEEFWDHNDGLRPFEVSYKRRCACRDIPEAVKERELRLIKKKDDLIRKTRKDLIGEIQVLPMFVQRLLDDYGESGFEMIGY